MSFPVRQLLTFALPPILGAIIGYTTNALAIKMLFRPLTEKRIFGVRIPFTPGIIPKKRYDLAHSIATMVSKELITPQVVQERLDGKEFEETIERQVADFTSSILATPIENLANPVKKHETDGAGRIISSLLKDAMEGGVFRDFITTIVLNVLKDFAEKPISSLFPLIDKNKEVIPAFVKNIFSLKNKDLLKCAFREAGFLENAVFRKEIQGTAFKVAMIMYPSLFDSLLSWLELPDTRRSLEVHGKKLVKSIVDKLSGIQRLFVTAGKFDRKIEENMPGIVDDIIAAVKITGGDERTRTNICTSLSDNVLRPGEERPGEERPGEENETPAAAFDEVYNLFTSAAFQLRISEILTAYMEKNKNISIRAAIAGILNKPGEEVVRRSADIIVSAIFSPPSFSGQDLGSIVRNTLFSYKGLAIGEFIGLKPGRKREVDIFIAKKIIALLKDRIPGLIESFDIYKLVTDRINSLNIESVENLLLMVIEKHLKWINVFGGIIGAFIGATQVLIRLFL